jgi:hypothetical protein
MEDPLAVLQPDRGENIKKSTPLPFFVSFALVSGIGNCLYIDLELQKYRES